MAAISKLSCFVSVMALGVFLAMSLPQTSSAQSPAMADQPHHHRQPVQVQLDHYEDYGQVKEEEDIYDLVYFDWHVDGYHQHKPPYKALILAYYGNQAHPQTNTYSMSEDRYSGTDCKYVFKFRRPKEYHMKKPLYYDVRIAVVGNQGIYEYSNPHLTF